MNYVISCSLVIIFLNIFTGGDDCKFKCFDQRLQFEKPVFENKEHGQGVTTCSSNKIRTNIIATGRLV